MTAKTMLGSDDLYRYVLEHAPVPDPVEQRLRARTAELGEIAEMQITHDQAVLTTLLTRLTRTRLAVEVGTFTGISALAIARGLEPGGRLICCDMSKVWTALAQQAWAEAGVDDRIELRLAPALETLRAMPTDPVVDLAFVDADKEGYVAYHEELVPRLRPDGLLLVDNALQGGRVADPNVSDPTVQAIRGYNRHASDDPRVEGVIVPVADGLFVLRRTEHPATC